MSYKRKTEDEYRLMALVPDYSPKGSTWEEISCYENFREAKADKFAYLKNDKSFLDLKIIKKRVKK